MCDGFWGQEIGQEGILHEHQASFVNVVDYIPNKQTRKFQIKNNGMSSGVGDQNNHQKHHRNQRRSPLLIAKTGKEDRFAISLIELIMVTFECNDRDFHLKMNWKKKKKN